MNLRKLLKNNEKHIIFISEIFTMIKRNMETSVAYKPRIADRMLQDQFATGGIRPGNSFSGRTR
jgi:hypothetical protein